MHVTLHMLVSPPQTFIMLTDHAGQKLKTPCMSELKIGHIKRVRAV